MGECFANGFSNDVEKYEIEVIPMSQNNPLFLQWYSGSWWIHCS